MTEALHAPQPSELVEHFLAEAISNSPQPLKDLAEFLSNALSEDDWKTADRLLLALALRIQAPDSWRPIETAPKDGSNFDSQDRTNYGKRVFTKTHWYVHPSVQDWVTDEIDCGDYEFEPTHWRPSALTGSAQR